MKRRNIILSKLKQFLLTLWRFFVRYCGYIDCLILYYVIKAVCDSSNNQYYMILYFIPAFLLFINIRFTYRIIKSKILIKTMAKNNRVQGFEGSQGRGKTSLMLYMASVLKKPIYSNIPFKIRGDFTYVLGTDIINLKSRVKENSILIFDEITLYYNNLMTGKSKDEKHDIYSFELLLQLCRHFFDGNIFTASVSMGRVPAVLEEKYSIFNRVLCQTTKINSFIIAPLLYLFGLVFKKKIDVGIRVWTYQTFERIDHENYYFDLSTNKESVKDQYYANLINIYAYNNSLDFDYNDRFMRFLYEQVAFDENKKFENLDFDMKSLSDTGFRKIINHFDKINKKSD